MLTALITFSALIMYGYFNYITRREMWEQIDSIDNDMFAQQKEIDALKKKVYEDVHGDMPNIPAEMIASASNPLPANIQAAE